MIIGDCGFSWYGSSAVCDYLKEYEGFDVCDWIEFILAYHPDGLSDLDYNLNINCAKFLSSGVAIPRFQNVSKLLLNNVTHGKIVKLTEDYLEKLVQVRWLGMNGAREYLLGHPYIYGKIVERIINRRLYARIPEKIAKRFKLYPLKEQCFSIRPDKFIEYTQEYIDSILECLGLDLNKKIVLNQPFAGNVPTVTMKYFRDAKAIIVDRDPRDLYLLAKEYYPTRTYQTPHDNVEDFISFFINMHKTLAQEVVDRNVLKVRFEDMVYNYNSTSVSINKFIGISEEDHISPLKYFDPSKSVANTRRFEKCKKYSGDIAIIESELKDYLFDFSNFQIDNSGVMFDESWEVNGK